MIDGNMFLNLTDRDLKDLFENFVVRKKIRDIQMQQVFIQEFSSVDNEVLCN